MKSDKRHISSKLVKARALSGSKELRSHLPVARKMNRDTLRGMLQKHGMVYIKPCCGSLGRGVIRIERLAGTSGGDKKAERWRYQYQAGTRVRTFAGYDAAWSAIMKEIQGESYLVQKGIRLLAYEGRPFDIRVMVQRNLKRQWEASGIAGRVAHPRKVVTNGSQGGTIYPVEILLRAYASNEKGKALIAAMKELGVKAARQLAAVFPGIQEIGVDIALDRRLKPWILEVNTNPDPCPFTKLGDGRMLRRIIRYGKAHGRTYSLKCTKSKRGVV
jgi:hypothetical protein